MNPEQFYKWRLSMQKPLLISPVLCKEWIDATELETPSSDSPNYEEELKRVAAAEVLLQSAGTCTTWRFMGLLAQVYLYF